MTERDARLSAEGWVRWRWLSGTLAFSLITAVMIAAGIAAQDAGGMHGQPPMTAVETGWGGHLKLRGSAAWPRQDSVLGASGKSVLYDGNAEGRLKTELFFDDGARFDSHYEIVLSGGDTRREKRSLGLPGIGPRLELFSSERIPTDRHRLFDLTGVISEDDSRVLYQRFDRLFLTLYPEWGTLRIGRQAVTWGNGFLFNPMDLFNPFAPTDIEREYKLGDDLALVQVPFAAGADLQGLVVPRRDPETGDVERDQSAMAAKLHWRQQTVEFDCLAAFNYGDLVFGIGAVGYAGGAAWRTDVTWTRVDDAFSADDYLSLTANLDYAWSGWGKNFYGFLEFFYNGIGERETRKIFGNDALLARLVRGDLFVVGRLYLNGMIQMEPHPLCNVFLTNITNLDDPSGILQPRVTWDVAQNVQLLFGGTVSYGGSETEFGGFTLPGTPVTTAAPAAVFAWCSYYF